MKNFITINTIGDDIRLSEEIRMFLIMQVPKGRLTREEDILKFICKLYGAATIDFEQPIKMRMIPQYDKYWNSVLDNVPFHRVVSFRGETYEITKIDKLESEGFILLSKPKGRDKKVENYKQYLFDFEKETTIDRSILDKVQQEGIEQFFNQK